MRQFPVVDSFEVLAISLLVVFGVLTPVGTLAIGGHMAGVFSLRDKSLRWGFVARVFFTFYATAIIGGLFGMVFGWVLATLIALIVGSLLVMIGFEVSFFRALAAWMFAVALGALLGLSLLVVGPLLVVGWPLR